MSRLLITALLVLFLAGCCVTKKSVSESTLETHRVEVGEHKTDTQVSKTDSSETQSMEFTYTETIFGDSISDSISTSVHTPIITRTWSVKKERRNSVVKSDSTAVDSLRKERSEQLTEQSKQSERTQKSAPIWLLLVVAPLLVGFILYSRRI